MRVLSRLTFRGDADLASSRRCFGLCRLTERHRTPKHRQVQEPVLRDPLQEHGETPDDTQTRSFHDGDARGKRIDCFELFPKDGNGSATGQPAAEASDLVVRKSFGRPEAIRESPRVQIFRLKLRRYVLRGQPALADGGDRNSGTAFPVH